MENNPKNTEDQGAVWPPPINAPTPAMPLRMVVSVGGCVSLALSCAGMLLLGGSLWDMRAALAMPQRQASLNLWWSLFLTSIAVLLSGFISGIVYRRSLLGKIGMALATVVLTWLGWKISHLHWYHV